MFRKLDPARSKKPETNRDRPRIYRENWKMVHTFTESRSNPLPSRFVQSGSQISRSVFARARNISDRRGCVLELDRKSSRLDKTCISNYLHPSGKRPIHKSLIIDFLIRSLKLFQTYFVLVVGRSCDLFVECLKHKYFFVKGDLLLLHTTTIVATKEITLTQNNC